MEINMLSLASSADFSYVNTGDLLADAIEIIDSAQKFAHGAVNYSLVMRNWLAFKRSETNLWSCNLRGLAVADALANGRSAEAQRSAGEPDTDHWTTHWMIIYYSSFFDSIITI